MGNVGNQSVKVDQYDDERKKKEKVNSGGGGTKFSTHLININCVFPVLQLSLFGTSAAILD